jgi:hypothetical protein
MRATGSLHDGEHAEHDAGQAEQGEQQEQVAHPDLEWRGRAEGRLG